MFSGASGYNINANSQLDSGPAQSAIDQHYLSELTLEQWYAQGPNTTPPLQGPAVQIGSNLDQQHHNFIYEFHAVQIHTATAQNIKGKGKGKGLLPERHLRAPPSDDELSFDGDERSCSICTELFLSGERVLRLVCRHMFHIECWHNMLIHSEEETERCPNCRGSARVISRFPFVAPSEAEHHQISTPPAASSRAPSNDSHLSFASASAFPWCPAAGIQPEGYFHASTNLAGGRLGILVDPGAWTNLAGKTMARSIAAKAMQHGHQASQWRMKQPLAIQGVGNGVQQCIWETRLPIAVPSGTGESELHFFETPTVEGTGADLPALLGLRSMRAKCGVLEMAAGRERLTFPGAGGYPIDWAPGAQHFQLECAPSGHLILPCGEFATLRQPQGGVPPTSTTFHATRTAAASSSSSGASSSSAQPPQPAQSSGSSSSQSH